MATQKELIEQAESLAKSLGIQVDTKGLSSGALNDLVRDLQRRTDEQALRTTDQQPPSREPNKPNDQDSPADQQNKQATDQQQRPPYSVAPGRSVTTARGVIGPGKEVRAEDVGGQENLDRLVQRGSVVKA